MLDSTCDGVDDDCDGLLDEDYVPEEVSCGAGACENTGVSACVAGAVIEVCAPLSGENEDTTCDGVDNDCDGSIDEDFVATATTCGAGACASTGTATCEAGVLGYLRTRGSFTQVDVCDGIDNDCDGKWMRTSCLCHHLR